MTNQTPYLSQFEKFWTNLSSDPQLELPDGTKDVLKMAWAKVDWPNKPSSAKTEIDTRKKRSPNGYNLFIKDKIATLTGEGVPKSDRMKQANALWKELPEDQKKTWSTEAKKNAVGSDTTTKIKATTSNEKKPRKLSGYIAFMKINMPKLTAEGVGSNQRMIKISELWGALTKEQKQEWKERAENMSTEVAVGSNEATKSKTSIKADKKKITTDTAEKKNKRAGTVKKSSSKTKPKPKETIGEEKEMGKEKETAKEKEKISDKNEQKKATSLGKNNGDDVENDDDNDNDNGDKDESDINEN